MGKGKWYAGQPSAQWWQTASPEVMDLPPAVRDKDRDAQRVNRRDLVIREEMEASAVFGPDMPRASRSAARQGGRTGKRVTCPCGTSAGVSPTGELNAHWTPSGPSGTRCFGLPV